MHFLGVEVAALANSLLCLLFTVAVAVALRESGLKRQLKALRILTSYATVTLLVNIYLLGVVGGYASKISLALSAAAIIALWIAVYLLWAKGE